MSTSDPQWSTQPDPAVAPPAPGTPDPSATDPSAPPADPQAPTPAGPDAPAAPDAVTPSAPAADPSPVSEPAPVDQPVDVASELDQLRQRLADLEQSTKQGQLSLQETDSELAQKVEQLREQYASWPQRGPSSEFADQPQPFDLRAHGLPQPGVTRDHLPGGEPDQISPVVVAHDKPLLTTGMAGPYVAELAGLLSKVGYPTSISEGRNGVNAFDDTVAAAVNYFKRDFHVQEDPSQFPDQATADRMVGPYIWEALIRAAKLAEKA